MRLLRLIAKPAQYLLALGLVVLVGQRLAQNWQEVRAAHIAWRFDIASLVIGAVLTWLAYAGLIYAWLAVLSSWGSRLPPLRAARIWALSSLGRYLPGKVWTVTGMALLSQRAGIPIWQSTISAIVLQLLAISTGVLTAAIGGTVLWGTLTPTMKPLAIAAMAGAGVTTALLLMPSLIQRGLRYLPRLDHVEPPASRPLVMAATANVAAWLLYGLAFWLTVRGTLPDLQLSMPLAIGIYAASYVVGFLAPFAPGGLGVRESVIIVLLGGAVGLGQAAAIAMASRLFITVAELCFVLPLALRSEKIRESTK